MEVLSLTLDMLHRYPEVGGKLYAQGNRRPERVLGPDHPATGKASNTDLSGNFSTKWAVAIRRLRTMGAAMRWSTVLSC